MYSEGDKDLCSLNIPASELDSCDSISSISDSDLPISPEAVDFLSLASSPEFLDGDGLHSLEFSMNSVADEKYLDMTTTLSNYLSRIKDEFAQGEDLFGEGILRACLFGSQSSSTSWLAVVYKNIAQNAMSGRLASYGIRNKNDISLETFAKFVATYLEIALHGTSIQQYYGLSNLSFREHFQAFRIHDNVPPWHSPSLPQSSICVARNFALPEKLFRGYLAGLKRVSSQYFVPGSTSRNSEEVQNSFSMCNSQLFPCRPTFFDIDGSKSITGSCTVLETCGSSTRSGPDRKLIVTDHVLAHSSTGLCLAIRRQDRGKPVEEAIMQLLDSVVASVTSDCGASRDLRGRVFEDCRLFMDRGYWTPRLIESFLEQRISIHGTIKKTVGPFSSDVVRMRRGQQHVPSGPLHAAWATTSTSRDLFYVAFRNGKSKDPAFLMTSGEKYSPRKWIYDVDMKKASATSVAAPSEFSSIFANIRQITCRQASREWFLARLLRFTSTSSSALLRLAVKSLRTDLGASEPDSMLVCSILRYQPDLSFLDLPPMVPTSILSEQSLQCHNRAYGVVEEILSDSSRSSTTIHTASGLEERLLAVESNEERIHAREHMMLQLHDEPQVLRTSSRKVARPAHLAEFESGIPVRRIGKSRPKRKSNQLTQPEVQLVAASQSTVAKKPRTSKCVHPIVSFFKAQHLQSIARSEKSFAMKIGSLNEPQVFSELLKPFLMKQSVLLLWKEAIGMVANIHNSVLATSVDGVCALQLPNGEIVVAVLEIKTRSSDQEKQRLQSIAFQFKEFNAEDDSFSIVPSENRQQLLHHAAVYDIECVLFVESTASRGISLALLIHFSYDIRSAYRRCLAHVQQKFLSWLYGPLERVPVAPANGLEFGRDGIPERECILLHMETFRFLDAESRNHVLPHCSAFMPSAVSSWNKFKGGVDLSDQFSAKFNFRNAVDQHQRYFLTCMEKACVNFHILFSFFVISRTEDLQNVSTHAQYKKMREKQGLTFSNTVSFMLGVLPSVIKERTGLGTSPSSEVLVCSPAQSPSHLNNVSVTEYREHCEKMGKSRGRAFQAFNTCDSVPWRIRHFKSAPGDRNPMILHRCVNYRSIMEVRYAAGRGAKDSVLKRPQACSYCHFRGNRRPQKSKDSNGEDIEVVLQGSETRWYCEGCGVFLCNVSYGLSGSGDPLPSCFDLWHQSGTMIRPDDAAGVDRLPAASSQTVRLGLSPTRNPVLNPNAQSVCRGHPIHRLSVNTQIKHAAKLRQNTEVTQSTFRGETSRRQLFADVSN